MNEAQFVRKIRESVPSKESLISRNLPAAYIDELQSSYKIEKTADDYYEDAFVSFVNNYDLSKLSISAFSFDIIPILNDGNWVLGMYDADLLIQSNETWEVRVIDYHQPDKIVFECAQNGEMFMDALGVILENQRQFNEDGFGFDSKGLVEKATKLAGGNQFRGFYEVVFDYYEG